MILPSLPYRQVRRSAFDMKAMCNGNQAVEEPSAPLGNPT